MEQKYRFNWSIAKPIHYFLATVDQFRNLNFLLTLNVSLNDEFLSSWTLQLDQTSRHRIIIFKYGLDHIKKWCHLRVFMFHLLQEPLCPLHSFQSFADTIYYGNYMRQQFVFIFRVEVGQKQKDTEWHCTETREWIEKRRWWVTCCAGGAEVK